MWALMIFVFVKLTFETPTMWGGQGVVGGGGGWVWIPYPRDSTPYPRQIFPSIPPALFFSLCFFRVPPPKNQIFLPPAPAHLTPPPANFPSKAPGPVPLSSPTTMQRQQHSFRFANGCSWESVKVLGIENASTHGGIHPPSCSFKPNALSIELPGPNPLPYFGTLALAVQIFLFIFIMVSPAPQSCAKSSGWALICDTQVDGWTVSTLLALCEGFGTGPLWGDTNPPQRSSNNVFLIVS